MLTITEHGKFTVQINEHSKLTVQEWNVLYESFKTTKTPDVDTLRQFLAAPYTKVFKQADREHYHHQYMQALRVKLEALTTKPSSIEKTMTPQQLFAAQNPLWALNLTGNQINHVLNGATGYLKL